MKGYNPMNTVEEYQDKRQSKHDRLLQAAEKARKESDSMYKQARSMADVIPFGQPILVGHHSEKSDRNYRGRIHNTYGKAIELEDKADRLERRAKAIEDNKTIFSDDPQAIEKLSDKIVLLEKRQALMVAANKFVKKNDREGLADLGFSDAQVDKLFTPDFCGRLGFASYMITNNGANIRRLKDRQELLEKTRSIESSDVTIGDVKIADNIEDNRVQIFFPGKPSEEVRSELKQNGFKWAPSTGAWQRNYSQYASQIAKNIVQKYY